MVDVRASALLAHLAELERRDEALAADLALLGELAERAGAVRARGAEVRDELERVPRELLELDRLRHEAGEEAGAARSELQAAEERLAGLERARRKRSGEIDRARRETETARELLADAELRMERLALRRADIVAAEGALREEAAALVRAAHGLAGELETVARIGDAARSRPGETLEELEQWGALVRSGLFVARGTVEAEREGIVSEANALGESATGETLGGSSVELVRRRLERDLARRSG